VSSLVQGCVTAASVPSVRHSGGTGPREPIWISFLSGWRSLERSARIVAEVERELRLEINARNGPITRPALAVPE
jgi:hypothetical protein